MSNCVTVIQNDPDVPAGVFAELLGEWQVPFHLLRPDLGEALPDNAVAAIVLGGEMGAHDEGRHPFLREVKAFMSRMLATRSPLFGICLGGQLLAHVTGGEVRSDCCIEKGLVDICLTRAGEADPLFAGVTRSFRVFQWHNDSFTVPSGAAHLAGSVACPVQAVRVGNAWGVQFHPEVDGAVIATWSRRFPTREQLTADFAAVEQTHRALARQLLLNFLRLAGIFGQ